MLQNAIKENFEEIISLLENIDNQFYNQCHPELSNATIGEHTRHIIELYQSLLTDYELGKINYDKRERNLKIQTDVLFAISTINAILNQLDKPNKKLTLEQENNDVTYTIETNYERELLHNLEHSIHHQALIKVALIKDSSIVISENFGVAKSTIAFRKQCVQ